MSKIYELKPSEFQNQKSFYGKALVKIEDDGTETLYSYNTPIISRDSNGNLKRIWQGYSMTTGRHIRAFCDLSKAEFENL